MLSLAMGSNFQPQASHCLPSSLVDQLISRKTYCSFVTKPNLACTKYVLKVSTGPSFMETPPEPSQVPPRSNGGNFKLFDKHFVKNKRKRRPRKDIMKAFFSKIRALFFNFQKGAWEVSPSLLT